MTSPSAGSSWARRAKALPQRLLGRDDRDVRDRGGGRRGRRDGAAVIRGHGDELGVGDHVAVGHERVGVERESRAGGNEAAPHIAHAHRHALRRGEAVGGERARSVARGGGRGRDEVGGQRAGFGGNVRAAGERERHGDGRGDGRSTRAPHGATDCWKARCASVAALQSSSTLARKLSSSSGS